MKNKSVGKHGHRLGLIVICLVLSTPNLEVQRRWFNVSESLQMIDSFMILKISLSKTRTH